ncbi:hypothetical protein MSPP1_000949 [Malassezia sp. CBS 17886]|nr:hypothetical protein MSPP1_000949 [Malassezia sp. CBS 17886]
MGAPCVVVMGVSGAGKSTVGQALAQALRVEFLDADDQHDAAAVRKLSTGVALDDTDRAPWLRRVRAAALAHGAGSVVACSALRRSYRDILRAPAAADGGEPRLDMVVVYLRVPTELLRNRLARRQGHFMAASLLQSQLDALDEPSPESENVIVVDVTPEMCMDDIVSHAQRAVRARLPALGGGR